MRYEEGVQFLRWRDALDVIEGRGIDRQIRRAYGFIASRYRPGDRIFLFGYSRGAYAVRSLAGVIDQIGLLRADHATVRNIRQAYRHYEMNPGSYAAAAFAEKFCHEAVEIEMVGVWDTVKALGIRAPFLWRFSRVEHAFHNHTLGHSIRHGFHALAKDETRQAYAPVMWVSREGWGGVLEQVWFRGTHGDVGGHLGGFEPARKLANIPLVWMLETGRGLWHQLAGRLARPVRAGPERALDRHDAGLGQDVSLAQAAADRGGPVGIDPSDGTWPAQSGVYQASPLSRIFMMMQVVEPVA